MEILVGKTAGFCGGVKAAVQNTEKDLEKYDKIYCLGELVHNNEVIEALKQKGLKIVEDISQAKERVIVRAHGITKETYKKAKENNIELLDYTCKKVLLIHDLVQEYVKKDYYIILIGEYEHPEVIGTYSFCGEYKSKINKIEDIEEVVNNIQRANKNKVLIVAQTTFNGFKFDEIVKEIKNNIKSDVEIKVEKTICNATALRQNETVELSKKVELMIVIGGKNSSNTNKLYDISKNNCKNAIVVETYKEIDKNYVKHFQKIGIIAGASTPQKSIEEVINYIKD